MARRKESYVDFKSAAPVPQFLKPVNNNIGGVDTGIASTAPGFMWVEGDYFEWQGSTNRGAVSFVPTSAGWTLPLDNVDACGLEITQGVNTWNGRYFTVGTDAAFYLRVTLKLTTLANIDNLMVGFRRAGAASNTGAYGAYAGEFANIATVYTDYALIGVSDNAGTFSTTTELNNGGATTTALAHAAHVTGEYMQLEVNVSAAGAVTYRLGTHATESSISLAADASAIAYTFDDTDVVLPCLICGGTAAGYPNVQLVKWECGYQDLT